MTQLSARRRRVVRDRSHRAGKLPIRIRGGNRKEAVFLSISHHLLRACRRFWDGLVVKGEALLPHPGTLEDHLHHTHLMVDERRSSRTLPHMAGVVHSGKLVLPEMADVE